jgi:hypothetical protein
MKKVIIGLLVFWVGFNLTYNHVNAGEYDKAVLGHVITNSSDIDKQKLFEAELARIGHKYALEMVSIMQQYLPSIIDGAMADLRLKLDEQHKCLLLKDTKIADKQCQ